MASRRSARPQRTESNVPLRYTFEHDLQQKEGGRLFYGRGFTARRCISATSISGWPSPVTRMPAGSSCRTLLPRPSPVLSPSSDRVLDRTVRYEARERSSATAGGGTIGEARRSGHTASEALQVQLHIAGSQKGAGSISVVVRPHGRRSDRAGRSRGGNRQLRGM